MKNECIQAKIKKIILIVCLTLIGVVVLAFITFKIGVYMLIENAKRDIEWEDNIRINGPYGEEAIWKSEEEDVYLICQFDESIDKNAASRIRVTAYILYDGQWISTMYNIWRGSKTIEFFTDDGKIYLKGNIQLRDEKLRITNLDDFGNGIIGNRKEILLEKFSYQDMIEGLPFSIEEL